MTAGPKAPLLNVSGKKSKDVALAEGVFAAAVKPHLLHEAVRAEAAAARSGTRAAKTRALVSGGRSKPWRQKGTGRARAYAPQPRSFDVKVNRKARKAALRGALTRHAQDGTLAVVDPSGFAEPSTKAAIALVSSWDAALPLLVVAQPDEETLVKSFRNLDGVVVVEPSELEIRALMWARSLLASEAALARVQEVAS